MQHFLIFTGLKYYYIRVSSERSRYDEEKRRLEEERLKYTEER